ncbi:MAG TPA: GNAT family N-acetyltransferase [Symbiobacteriaceae bacterium]|nr:GNAT family N-acetyltransferase [Symbiobacteriaceae bacterium]
MQYRPVTQAEIEKLRRAEEYCFFISPDDYDPWVQRMMQPDYLRGIFGDDGELKAGLVNFPYQMYIGGAKLGMGGIAGVVSWPEHRREGNVGDLLVRLLHEEKEKGIPLSALYPFKQPFYRRYGWEVTAAWLSHEFPPELLAPYRASEGSIRRYAPGDADWRELERIYSAKFAARYGYLVRETEEFWADWVNPLWSRWGNMCHTAVWRPAPDRDPEGYLLYRFWKDDKGEQFFVVKELVALTPAAERGLWGYVAQHDSQVKSVRHRTLRDYPVWHLVENTKEMKSTLQSGWMLRFVDLQAAFEQRPWHGAPDGSFVIGVQDGHLPWNNGTFRLTFAAGRCTLTPAPAETAVLAADQRTWAQLYAGFVQPEVAVGTGKLTCSDNRTLQLLSQAIAGKELWFYEFF